MIEGLKLDFTTAQLKEHLGKKIAYHAERVLFYETQAKALRSGGAEAREFTGGDPVRSLEESRKKHQGRKELLQVISGHLVPGEVYRLPDGDLVKLELLSRYL
jgi:hypothetical protein